MKMHPTRQQIDNLVRSKIGMSIVGEPTLFSNTVLFPEVRKTILRSSLIVENFGVGSLSDMDVKTMYASPLLEETDFNLSLWFTFEMADGSLVDTPAEAVLNYEYKCEIL